MVDETRQQALAGRDTYVAGRDLIINGDARIAEPGVPALLPRAVLAFTGRGDELARLASLAGGGRVVVSAIGGTAGVGKTALAVHAAHQMRDLFPGGQLYADLRGYTEGQEPAEPGEVLREFLRRLGVPAEEIPVETGERSGLLRQVLATRRVLMVLDNARTEAQVRPLLPGTGESLVLVTSRSVLSGLEVDERISLDVLTEGEAAAMLARVIGTARAAGESQAVAEVARLCGRLPLALRIAGQLLAAHPAWPVTRLAEMLAGEQSRLARLGTGDLRVKAAFEVSYAQLAEEDSRLFRLLGLHPGPDLTAASAAALAATQSEEAELLLARLAEAHLVTEDATGRFQLHDLLRLYARQLCQETDDPADREAAEERLVSHYAALAQFLNSCVDPRLRQMAEQTTEQAGGTLPAMRDALAMFQAERPGLLAAFSLAARRGWDDQVTQLSNHMGVSLTVLRYPDDLLAVHEAMLAAVRRAGKRAAEGTVLVNLGMAYADSRLFDEAIGCFQQALVIFAETSNRLGAARALVSFGTVYGELRRFDEAADCLERSLVIFRETSNQYGEGQALANLGIVYRELRRLDEAIACLQQSMAFKRASGDRRGEAAVLNTLGSAYVGLERLQEADDCFRQALALCRETGDRHREGQTLNNLGQVCVGLGRFDEAAVCYQQDIVICREAGDRWGEGQTLNNLGNLHTELRRFDEAADSYQRALAVFREIGDRQGQGETLGNLGNLYAKSRRLDEAVDSYQRALGMFRETGDRLGEGMALDNLGNAYQELRQLGQAAECWQEAAAAMRDAGDHERAARLDQLAGSDPSR